MEYVLLQFFISNLTTHSSDYRPYRQIFDAQMPQYGCLNRASSYATFSVTDFM